MSARVMISMSSLHACTEVPAEAGKVGGVLTRVACMGEVGGWIICDRVEQVTDYVTAAGR
jgi:hypothetical protein